MSSRKKTSIVSKAGSHKRRDRRKKPQDSHTEDDSQAVNVESESKPKKQVLHLNQGTATGLPIYYGPCNCSDCMVIKVDIGTMTNDPVESREKVKASREAKKIAKQQAKMKRDAGIDIKQPAKPQTAGKKEDSPKEVPAEVSKVVNAKQEPTEVSKIVKAKQEPTEVSKVVKTKQEPAEVKNKVEVSSSKQVEECKSSDEVDRATVPIQTVGQVTKEIREDTEQIKAERAAKKAAKQEKKKDAGIANVAAPPVHITPKADTEMTVRDVVEALRDIKIVAQEFKQLTAQVQALHMDKQKPDKKSVPLPNKPKQVALNTDAKPKPATARPNAATKDAKPPSDAKPKGPDESEGKSKAELKAERRAKQEAQRAAKEAAQAKAAGVKPKGQNTQVTKEPAKEATKTVAIKEKSPKPKTPSKQSVKLQGHKVNWFRHLYNEDNNEKLNNIPINSNLHPAIIKLGVQLATRVVTGSNARCIALLDALKKMVRDYSLPARTEFSRGLEEQVCASARYLWRMREPAAAQLNALNHFRHHLTRLPNNVDEFDAKKTLQEEIDRYIREQIDMAGEAISIAVRKKICNGDNILTYGCSSLIERIFVEAHLAGVEFRAIVCGGGGSARGARDLTRRLSARGLRASCVDITALGFVMRAVDKVVLGARSVLANGAVLGACGAAAVALAARAYNKPVLVACETHKFCDRVQTDAFVYNEIGDPDDLMDKTDENSPLKDWRSNPNLTPLNLTYDVTPPNLITGVVTELAILPCTSAPVVLRFKLSEYSV